MRLTSRWLRLAVIVTATAAVSLTGGTAHAAAAQASLPAAPSTGSATRPVIVVLRDQLRATPADRSHLTLRASATGHAQDAVLGRLRGPRVTRLKHFTTGNAFAATVTEAQAQQLAADPAVAAVVDDTVVPVGPARPATVGDRNTVRGTAPGRRAAADAPGLPASPAAVDPQACGATPATAKLEPEALQTLNVRSEDPKARTAAALGFDGSGVKVAYIADGINPNNAGFIRPDGTSAVVDYQDFFGDGPNAPGGGGEAFGDASAVVAQGKVYDVATFANPKVVSFPGGHCYIRILGVAPGASVVGLKAGSTGLPTSAIVQSIDYAVRVAHVDVLNESFGGDRVPDYGARQVIELFNTEAVRAGVTVTVSSGDAGVTNTIGSPAAADDVISVGATTDNRIYEQTGYAFATLFGNGRWQDSNISALSSAGVTTTLGRTIDVSAPGEADWALCDSSSRTVNGKPVQNFSDCSGFGTGPVDIQSFGGTSQSAPLTAGVAALVIQAYRSAHGGDSPSPELVKRFMAGTARDLGFPGDEQGTGLVDARAAVEAALTDDGGDAPAGVSSNVVFDTDQLTLQGAPGTTATGTVRVTNAGRSPVTVTASNRGYGVLAQNRQDTTIDTTSGDTVPYSTNATPWVVKKLTFTVPPKADRLRADIIWQANPAAPPAAAKTTPVVRLSLFAPDGTFATNTRPQGGTRSANYGSVDVREPAAGTWTAVLYTPAKTADITGYTGPVSLRTTALAAVPAGQVSPSTARIAPGRSAAVTVRVPVPAVGGDVVDTLSIGSSTGQRTAVPVIVRPVLQPAPGVDAAFKGTITGGNARGTFAQRFSYAIDVPRGSKDLDVFLKLANDAATNLQTVLVDPNGEVQSSSSNIVQVSQTGLARGLYAQNVVADPVPGRWSLVVILLNAVSGHQFEQDFIGEVSLGGVAAGVSAPGLPADDDIVLPAGKPVSVDLTFKNTGVVPLAVQTDGRLNQLTTYQLAPIAGNTRVPLPSSAGSPTYLVPPDTRRLSVSATSTVPAQVQLSARFGGITVLGDLAAAQRGEAVSTATVSERSGQVVPGPAWGTSVAPIGPFDDRGAPTGESVFTATARTKAFDPAVSSSTGDPYLAALNPKADTGKPIIVNPGATGTITLTITPTGEPGTVVDGALDLVQPFYGANSAFVLGDVLQRIPYRYTVG